MSGELNGHIDVNGFLSRNNVMTVCTAMDGIPWCASVYYVHQADTFYFFSSSDSRHIRQAVTNPRASAGVSPDSDNWQSIQGVQMSGSISLVTSVSEKAAAVRAYLKKFPFVGDFLMSWKLNGHFFSKKLTKMDLYKFQADEVLFLDNRSGFGHRVPVIL